MTNFELQEVMGTLVSDVMDGNKTVLERDRILENANNVAKLAKQMINNSDLIIRAYKLANEGKIGKARIMEMIGDTKWEEEL